MVGPGIRPTLVVFYQIIENIDVEGEEERLPYLGISEFYAWQQIPESHVQHCEQREAEYPFIPSQLRFEQSETQLPSAPTGSTGGASRRIQGNIRLPPFPRMRFK